MLKEDVKTVRVTQIHNQPVEMRATRDAFVPLMVEFMPAGPSATVVHRVTGPDGKGLIEIAVDAEIGRVTRISVVIAPSAAIAPDALASLPFGPGIPCLSAVAESVEADLSISEQSDRVTLQFGPAPDRALANGTVLFLLRGDDLVGVSAEIAEEDAAGYPG